MNRRNFLRGIVIAGASFNILPGAGRIWKAQRPELVVNPAWVKAEYEIAYYDKVFLSSYQASFDWPADADKITFKRHV